MSSLLLAISIDVVTVDINQDPQIITFIVEATDGTPGIFTVAFYPNEPDGGIWTITTLLT